MLRSAVKLLKNGNFKSISVRSMTHYPIDDAFFGLTEEQSAVKYFRIFKELLWLKNKNKNKLLISLASSNGIQLCSERISTVCTRN